MNEYRQVRIDSRQFAVVAEHFIGDIERIVFENGRFAVAMMREAHQQTLQGTKIQVGS
jgi:hypothetical protein